jgi:hypothetical protein
MANNSKGPSLEELESELWGAVIAFNAAMAQLSFRIGNAVSAAQIDDQHELIKLRQTSRKIEDVIAPLINQQKKERPGSILQ